MDPIGIHHFWGFSPAVDVQQLSRTVFGADAASRDEPLNILLVCPGDPRSVLKTISQRFRHSARPLHFYVFERHVEVIARHLLLLAIATDWEIAPRVRAATWLEVFGNAFVQSRTAAYISSARLMLVDLVCSARGPPPLPSFLNFSALRYRTRDDLERTLKEWDARAPYDIALYRDTRVRANLGTRYDARENLADWDYQAILRTSVGVVHGRQYRGWRENGVAFEFGDQRYDAPNRSLASFTGARAKGRGPCEVRGFWGDTAVSPYHAVGTAAFVPSDQEAAAAALAAGALSAGASGSAQVRSHAHCLFDILNRKAGSEQWRHHAVEVATYNVLSWFHEIETGRPYVMTRANDIYSGIIATSAANATTVAANTAVAAASDVSTGGEAGGAAVGGSEKSGGGDAVAADPAPRNTLTPAAATAGDAGVTVPELEPAPASASVPIVSHATAALTSAESASVTATLRAAAAARASSIARTFRGVRVTLLCGNDFSADVLAKSGRAFGGDLIDAVVISGRAAGVLDAPALRSILAPRATVVVEAARNIPSLSTQQRVEFSRRIISMGARAGLVLVGTDRALSADTFSVGTVIKASDFDQKGGFKVSDASSATVTPAPAVSHFYVPLSGEACGLPPPDAGTTFGGLPPAVTVESSNSGGSGSAASESGETSVGRRSRAKALGMAAFSQRTDALPSLSKLLSAETAVDPARARIAAARAVAEDARAHARGIATHDEKGGDNPFPEAFVFAYLSSAATDIAEAFRAGEGEMEKGSATLPAASEATPEQNGDADE